MKKIDFAIVSVAFYVAFALISNVISTKIVMLPFFALAVDGGTLTYAFTFTLRDFAHKTVGKCRVRQLVVVTAILNALMVAAIWTVGVLPADKMWPFQSDYENILMSGIGRIVVASIIAQLIAELIDTEIFSRLYKKGSEVIAVIMSNTVGLIVDSVLFTIIAFYGVLEGAVIWEIMVVNFAVKYVVSILSSPVIKLIPRKVDMDEI